MSVNFDFGSLVAPTVRVIVKAIDIIRGRRAALTPTQVMEFHKRWKPEFEEKIRERMKKKLRFDAIVRDVRRLDQYPKITAENSGRPPWHRVGLADVYHSGIELFLGWHELKRGVTGRWRFVDYERGEEPDIKVALIGFVPFEQIEHVDWDGDEYYGFPVIFLHFDAPFDGPFTKMAFCRHGLLEHPEYTMEYFSEICDYVETRAFSKSVGIANLQ